MTTYIQTDLNQPTIIGSANKESYVISAVQAIQNDPTLSIRTAAKVYEVILATLSRRLKGRAFRRNIMPNSRKLMELEEKKIIEYVLDLEARSFPPRLCDVEDMVCWWETHLV